MVYCHGWLVAVIEKALHALRTPTTVACVVKGRSNRCIYCGIRVRGATCNAHRHLRRNDPLRTLELRRLSGDAPKIEHR